MVYVGLILSKIRFLEVLDYPNAEKLCQFANFMIDRIVEDQNLGSSSNCYEIELPPFPLVLKKIAIIHAFDSAWLDIINLYLAQLHVGLCQWRGVIFYPIGEWRIFPQGYAESYGEGLIFFGAGNTILQFDPTKNRFAVRPELSTEGAFGTVAKGKLCD